MISTIAGLGAFMPRPVQVLRFGAVAAAVYCVGMATLGSGQEVAFLSGHLELPPEPQGLEASRFCVSLDDLDDEALERLRQVCDGVLPTIGFCCKKIGTYIVDAMTCPAMAEHIREWVSRGVGRVTLAF